MFMMEDGHDGGWRRRTPSGPLNGHLARLRQVSRPSAMISV